MAIIGYAFRKPIGRAAGPIPPMFFGVSEPNMGTYSGDAGVWADSSTPRFPARAFPGMDWESYSRRPIYRPLQISQDDTSFDMSKATITADNQQRSIWNEFEIKQTYTSMGLRQRTPCSCARNL